MTKIILKVHIPQGEPLDEGKCRKFFEMAGKFFRTDKTPSADPDF